MTNVERLPARELADCAWCGAEFAHIVELLTHVEDLHLDHDAAA